MNDTLPTSPLAASLQTPSSRRGFLRRAGLAGAAAALVPAAASLFNPSTARAESATLDLDILNFALNLEYLEAEFYSYAVYGKSIEDQFGIDTSGVGGSAGELLVKDNFQPVSFTDPVIASYAKEIANDEANHVIFLRSALGSAAVARPDIDLHNSFTILAATASGTDSSAFDPFMDDQSFLLGSFIFEDVGVTAYHGAAPMIESKAILGAAAGILAVEAYHAAEVRTVLYGLAQQSSDPQMLIDRISAISALRASLGGGKDQGIGTDGGDANIVPTDSLGIAFARKPRKILNIVYGKKLATSGLFFPSGMNGAIR